MTLDRRRALGIIGLTGTGLLAAPVLAPLHALAAAPRPGVHSRTRPMMGTFVTLTVAHPSRAKARDAMARAFAAMDAEIAVFDRFDKGSAVSELNRSGRLDHAPRELLHVARLSRRVYDLSQGRFDPTVLPVARLLEHGEPDPADLAEALELVGAEHLELDMGMAGDRLRLTRSGMGLTLDGVAKGRVADAGSAALTAAGATDHLVDAGGDIVAQGLYPGENGPRPWRVAVRRPDPSDHAANAATALAGAALATSGGYETAHGTGMLTRHHILDPNTGRSPSGVAGATVRADTCAQADALATACCVMTPRQALALVARADAHCLLLTHHGGALASPGW